MADLPDLLALHSSPAVRLMLFARAVEAWSTERAAKHKRDSKGRFTRGSGVSHALSAGDEEALGGMSREQLRREARSRGITLKRGASLDEIKDALWDHHNDQKGDSDPDRDEDKHPIDERAELRAIKLAEIEAGGGARGKHRDEHKDRFDRADIAIERYQDALKFEGQDDPRWDRELAEAKVDLDTQGIKVTDLGYEVKGRNGKPVVLQPAKLNGPTGDPREIRKNLGKLAGEEAKSKGGKPQTLDAAAVDDAIREMGGTAGMGPRIITTAQLKERFPDMSMDEFKATVEQLERDGKIDLQSYPDQKMLSRAEKDSSIPMGAGPMTLIGSKDGGVRGPHRQRWENGETKPTEDEEAAFVAAIEGRKAKAKAEAEAAKAKAADRYMANTHQLLQAAKTEAAARDLVDDLEDDELPDMAKRMGFTPGKGMSPDALREKIVSLAGPKRAAPSAKAQPKSKPTPAKAMTPEATLAAAPKAINVDDKGRSLPAAQTRALERYQGDDFFEINQHLRGRGEGKKPAGMDRTVADMDAAFASSRLTEDVTVHRGISNVSKVFGPAAGKSLVGASWTDAAPQSTSADPVVADRFARNEAEWGPRTEAVMSIRVPKGTGAVQLSDGRYEAEMLLERGLRLRVVSDTGPAKKGQKTPRVIEVEVVPA